MPWHAIAALDWQGCIGVRNALPWHLPADLAHFRQLTAHHTVLMGRKTFESIGHALPNRRNLVISRTVAHFKDAERYDDLSLALASILPSELGYVIGGAQIYAAAWPHLRQLDLTVVDGRFEGDAYFPKIEPTAWKITAFKKRPRDAGNPFHMWFVQLVRAEEASEALPLPSDGLECLKTL